MSLRSRSKASSIARQRSMTRTSDCGAPRASVARDGACRVMCCARTAWVDGAVNGVAWGAKGGSMMFRRAQSGLVQNYALIMGGGIVRTLLAILCGFIVGAILIAATDGLKGVQQSLNAVFSTTTLRKPA